MDIRDDVVNRFYEVGNIEWTPSRSIYGRDEKILYRQGVVYHGMPFSRRNWIFYDEFLSKVKNGVYQIPDCAVKIPGVNCAGSIIWALSKYMKIPLNYETLEIMCDRNLTLFLGVEFQQNDLIENQDLIFADKEKIFEAYALLKKGDIVGRYFKKNVNGGWYGHLRLVTGNVSVVKDKNKKVVSNLSTIEYSDNNTYFVTKEQNTNFVFNKKCNFLELINDRYIPLTFCVY